MQNKIDSNEAKNVVIWDLPTRIFHWSFVASFVLAWLTFDDNRYLFVHVYAGYVFLSLLVFRLIWGLIGSRYARFRAFSYDWPSVLSYLKGLLNGEAAKYIGHNPAGSWAIFLMLILGIVVSVAGILVLGGEEGHGVFAPFISYAVGEGAKEVHEVVAWFMLMVTVVHVGGVIVESFYHRDNLILSMITGQKEVTGKQSVTRHNLLGIIIVITLIISALFYFKGYLKQTAEQPYVPFVGSVLPDNETWRSECGDCHLAYYPVLLPARSWTELLRSQTDHFEEDLGLDDKTLTEIQNFLIANASESELNEPARKINASTPSDATPTRVIDTVYWKKKHEKIKNVYWKHELVGNKGNCEACHLDAVQGSFEDSAMRLPKLP